MSSLLKMTPEPLCLSNFVLETTEEMELMESIYQCWQEEDCQRLRTFEKLLQDVCSWAQCEGAMLTQPCHTRLSMRAEQGPTGMHVGDLPQESLENLQCQNNRTRESAWLKCSLLVGDGRTEKSLMYPRWKG